MSRFASIRLPLDHSPELMEMALSHVPGYSGAAPVSVASDGETVAYTVPVDG